MTDIGAWLDFLPHSVQRKAFLRRANDGYGTPSYSATATTYQARVRPEIKLVTAPDGQEVVATHVAWLGSTAVWNPEDQFTFESTTYRIVSVDRFPDELGAHHVRLRLKG